MDILHALVWPYLAHMPALWSNRPPDPGEPEGPTPGLVDESN